MDIFLLFLAIALSKCGASRYSQKNEHPAYSCKIDASLDHIDEIPKYHISLNTHPADRWTPIIKDNSAVIEEFIAHFVSLIGTKLSNLAFYLASKSIGIFDHEIQDELQGMSKASGIEISKFALMNIFYEMFTACTSIIAKDVKTGNIYHSRNLDFGLLMGYDDKEKSWKLPGILRKMTVHVIWEDNDKVIGESIHFAGYVGILTGVRKDKFSFSFNSRFSTQPGMINLIKYALFGYDGKLPGLLAREVLLSGADYNEAREILSKEKLFASVYFILGAPKDDGCIISRDVADARILDLKDSPDSWFLVQTNYDNWDSPLFIDDRRTPAKECMKSVFKQERFMQNYTLGIYNVLRTRPVMNQLTTFQGSMSSSSGILVASKERCSKPCPLF